MQPPITFTTHRVELSSAEQEQAEERILRACHRFLEHIRRVAVRITDINGPRGGEDKQCSLTVVLKDGRILTSVRKSTRSGPAIARSLAVVRSKLQRSYGQRKAQPVDVIAA